MSEASSAVGGRGGAKKRRLPAWATASAGGSSRRGRDDDDVGGFVLSFVLVPACGSLDVHRFLRPSLVMQESGLPSPPNFMCTAVLRIIIFLLPRSGLT